MLFYSPVFLMAFLPLSLLFYFAVEKKYKNIVLFALSIVFYTFGAPVYVLLLLSLLISNYLLAIKIDKLQEFPKKLVLVLALVLNVGSLLIFKYIEFLSSTISGFFSLFWTGLGNFVPIIKIAYMIGISFYALRSISYIIDVYKGSISAEKSFIKLGTYLCMFPMLICGPMTHYAELEPQISKRDSKLEDVSKGLLRFAYGLAKKLLIANNLIGVANNVFNLAEIRLTFGLAWVGILSFIFYVYYEFTGYIDMSIGLGRVFGFKLPENFDYPFMANSITNFFNRFNFTISNWFKEYVYLGNGGNPEKLFYTPKDAFLKNEGKLKNWTLYILTLLLYGFWYGPSTRMLFITLFLGIFFTLEKWSKFKYLLEWEYNSEKAALLPSWQLKILQIMKYIKPVLAHLYTLIICIISFIILKADSYDHFSYYTRALFGNGYRSSLTGTFEYFDNEAKIALVFAFLLISPFIKKAYYYILEKLSKHLKAVNISFVFEAIKICVIVFVVFLCCISVVGNTEYSNNALFFNF